MKKTNRKNEIISIALASANMFAAMAFPKNWDIQLLKDFIIFECLCVIVVFVGWIRKKTRR